MKHLLTLTLLLTINICFSQKTPVTGMDETTFFASLDSIISYPEKLQELLTCEKDMIDFILEIDNYTSVFQSTRIKPFSDTIDSKKFKKEKKSKLDCDSNKYLDVKGILLDLCDLKVKNNAHVPYLLSEFRNTFSLQYMFKTYLTDRELITNCRLSEDCISPLTYEQNLAFIKKRIGIIDGNNYNLYDSYYAEPKKLKSIEMHHDNDVLLLYPKMNQDREYTGGFKFTVATDYLKWRFIRLKNKGVDNILTYQTISLGGQGYTPYIRYRNNFDLADSLFLHDRPFGSSVYIERAKNRVFRNGLVRQKGEFQVGMIGLSSGKKIQAQIHEDLTHESQFVHGWEQQIGEGGRLFFQTNQDWQFLLYSTNNRYKTIFLPRTIQVKENKRKVGLNLIAEGNGRFGSYYTSLGAGFRVSTLNFLDQSANELITTLANTPNFGFKVEAGINYRYVFHNTMLEGLGIWNTFPLDAYDKVNPDYYVLDESQINRNIFTFDLAINLRFRKSTVYFKQTFQSLEYTPELRNVDFQNSVYTKNLNPDDTHFYNTEVIPEQEKFLSRNFYGFGTLGINWIID